MRKLPNRPSFMVTEKLVGYFLCGVFALILWGIAIWMWNTFFYWFVPKAETRWDWTVVLTVLALPVPFWVYQNLYSPDRPARSATPMPAAPAQSPAVGITTARPDRLPGLGWLYWLGNGELHWGTLVLLIIFFWSLFFWNWPTVKLMWEQGNGVFAFSFWGLVTIFGTVLIRSVFSRLPGAGVPGSGDSKSKPK